MKKKIGLYGGTFNPFHFGHLNLAIELKEKAALSEVWFIPTHISPLRAHMAPISAEHRYKMLEVGIQDVPGFKICDFEIRRPPPSYTIDTLKEILKNHPMDEFYLLFGEDSLVRFQEWKEPLEIVRLLPFLIGSRPKIDLLKRLPSLNLREEIAAAIRKGIIETPQLDISASRIRERLKKKLYCRHLIPGKTVDYIYENQLYFNGT